MPGPGDIRAGKAYVEVGADIQPLKSALDELKRGLGGGSAFKGVFDILKGSGAAIGLTLAANAAKQIAEGFSRVRDVARDVDKNWADVAMTTMKALPIVGQIAEAGEAIHEAFTGAKAELEALNVEAKRLDDFTKSMRDQQAQITKSTQVWAGILKEAELQSSLALLSGSDKERAESTRRRDQEIESLRTKAEAEKAALQLRFNALNSRLRGIGPVLNTVGDGPPIEQALVVLDRLLGVPTQQQVQSAQPLPRFEMKNILDQMKNAEQAIKDIDAAAAKAIAIKRRDGAIRQADIELDDFFSFDRSTAAADEKRRAEEEARRRGEQVRQGVRTPGEVAAEARDEFSKLFQAGAIDMETFNRAVRKTAADLDEKLDQALDDVFDFKGAASEATKALDPFSARGSTSSGALAIASLRTGTGAGGPESETARNTASMDRRLQRIEQAVRNNPGGGIPVV